MPPEARLALLALAVRAFVLLATTSLDAALPDYDSSKHITPASPPPASWADAGDAATSARLQRPNTAPSMQGWVVWDSVFYADIGARGYVFEQYYAFFPGFPGEQWQRQGRLITSSKLLLPSRPTACRKPNGTAR